MRRRDFLKTGFILGAAGILIPARLAGANQYIEMMIDCVKAPASGGSTCSTEYYSFTTSSAGYYEVGLSTGQMFIGGAWSTTTFNATVCAVQFYVINKTGSSRDYQAEIWSYNSGTGTLTTILGTSSVVASSSMTAGTWQSFSFSTPVTVNATSIAVVITPKTKSVDASNYVSVCMYESAAAGDPAFARWNTDYTVAYSRDQSRVLIKVMTQ